MTWFRGASTDPSIGIDMGKVTFEYSRCREAPTDPMCAYYNIPVSFLFTGSYQANVQVRDSETVQLVTINRVRSLLSSSALPSPPLRHQIVYM